MKKLIQDILMWSEIWALLIPLTIIIFFRPKAKAQRPLIYYVFTALLLNCLSVLITFYIEWIPSYIKGNNFLYNIHSVVRVLFFAWYVRNLKIIKSPRFVLGVLAGYIIIAAYLVLSQPYNNLSSLLFATESTALLLICLMGLVNVMLDESGVNWIKHPSFYIIAGIIFFEIVNFFTFPFLQFLSNNISFGLFTLQLFSFSFIILCVLLAITIYRTRNSLVRVRHD